MAQAPKKIIVEHSDFADVNQAEMPDAFLLTGNVRVNHDGVVLTCNKAYYFQKEKGVISTQVGYTGGTKENPTYKEVCNHTTGHVEALEITFDPSQIKNLIEQVFTATH